MIVAMVVSSLDDRNEFGRYGTDDFQPGGAIGSPAFVAENRSNDPHDPHQITLGAQDRVHVLVSRRRFLGQWARGSRIKPHPLHLSRQLGRADLAPGAIAAQLPPGAM